MRHSSPANADGPNGRRISGVAVVFGLVLLVIAGAGLAVALYLKMGRVSFLHRVAAEIAAEGQTERAADPSDKPPFKTGAPPGKAQVVEVQPEPRQESDQSGFELTELSPIEIVGAAADASSWRRPMRIGERVYDQAVSLRPAEDQGVAQIAFALQARFVHFYGFAAIADDPPLSAAGADPDSPRAVFRVYGDGNLLWESETLAGSGKRQSFECPVSGVDVLTLVAESQSPANISNFAWGDLRLRPVEKTTPETHPRQPKTR